MCETREECAGLLSSSVEVHGASCFRVTRGEDMPYATMPRPRFPSAGHRVARRLRRGLGVT